MELPGNIEQLNHAYISSVLAAGDIWSMLEEKNGLKKNGNPDVLELELETFGIDESRALIEWAIKKPFGYNKKIAVISALSVTIEAQNALLKLFEEPPEKTHFFLLTPQVGSILPTLLSRVRLLDKSQNIGLDKAREFLAGNIRERLKMIAPIVKNKDKEKARNIVAAMNRLMKDERLLQAEKYLSGRSPSIKIIMEYLAVIMVDSRHV